MTPERAAGRDIVLLGIGHTHAHVVQMWRMHPIPGARLTCVSNFPVTTYSGMLPGVMAGQYAPEAMEIDLVQLCRVAGAQLVVGEVTGLDVSARTLSMAGHPPLPFDILSVGVGSVTSFSGVEVGDDQDVVAIKPMQTFLTRLAARFRREPHEPGTLRVTVIGGGAGGAEIAMCLPPFVQRTLGDAARLRLTLVTDADRILSDGLVRTSEQVSRILRDRGVAIVTGRRVARIDEGVLALDDGATLVTDVAIWATGAAAPPVLGAFDLPKDPRGFLLTHHTLQSAGGAPVFVVGDSGTIAGAAAPKAGVYAVRQGPVLWRNMQRMIAGKPLERFEPQRRFLKLLNTGDGRAIGEWRGFTFAGRYAWRLKDHIDRAFVARYQHPPMPQPRRPGD